MKTRTSYRMETLADLLASLDRTNNGYLFAPTGAEMAIARQHPEAVDIRGGQIHRKGVQPPHPAIPEPRPVPDSFPDFDYEGAILARQCLADYW